MIRYSTTSIFFILKKILLRVVNKKYCTVPVVINKLPGIHDFVCTYDIYVQILPKNLFTSYSNLRS